MSSQNPNNHHDDDEDDREPAMLDPMEADEVIDVDGDVPMDDEDDDGIEEAIALQNDSSAHFDAHNDSIFCISQHPTDPSIVATGGGDDLAYIFDSTPEPSPVLPSSYQSNPQPVERKSLDIVARLEGHTDSVNALTFTLPRGEYLVTAGLDGQVLVWKDTEGSKLVWKNVANAKEVEEINWVESCPSPAHPNSIALGASDGSVWVYEIGESQDAPLSPVQAYYLHSGPCTAGAWTSDGNLLSTISEDGSFYVWDPWGEAAAAGTTAPNGGQALVTLTPEDERFKVEGGLYSIAISPGGTLAAVGGAQGMIRVVGLPKLAKGKGGSQASGSQAGQILASLQAQTDSVETLSFSDPPTTLLAAGSVDGSIVLFDVAHRYALRRRIEAAHEEEAVIKVEFVHGSGARVTNSWILTSAGNDGIVRRWDCRGGTAAAAKGLIQELKGHRGGGEEGGVLGFVQSSDTGRIVTAGDDSVSLVFNAPL
ncbi:WD40 repeat-like protein [Microthyrium microscopicum]|uniref:WD40 repeat-like protein n=1 Tax=Microthyrium microscopicum TaxID=703497 RepID=A0A6A6UNB2_9PEZI|nr:WD40 repeat-like protein [Microthyrium microscopicum]